MYLSMVRHLKKIRGSGFMTLSLPWFDPAAKVHRMKTFDKGKLADPNAHSDGSEPCDLLTDGWQRRN